MACLSLALPVQAAEQLTVAAASDLQFVLAELNQAFTRAHPGVNIKVSTGSSGNFFAQISQGAPFDLFLSADVKYPKSLVDKGQALPDSLMPYAVGRLALWTMNPRLDPAQGLSMLRNPAVRRIAIANPAHAPYGRAAREALSEAGLLPALQGKLVMGENISQTAQFVQSGNADAGIVALSLLRSPKLQGQGRYWLIPADSYTPLEQAAVITRYGAKNPVAREYMAFLKSPAARQVFIRNGFLLPGEH
ncbi:molybdate ABC transporter substrate-binding protein [Thermithiobacillus plumbiphilus]|uniref:Molybdate ABC transporter substrate-binding protein n=1 Tax=Thermithiobacillus plumbiphilus TaxID=1729899 RepID=A0ABU9D6B9_9PROT